MESQDIKYVGIDCGKKSLEVVRIHSENSLKERVITSYSIHYTKLYDLTQDT
ncbi:hypothetical protein LEP1GSC175_3589 [Leptospira santarosai str. HAI821]|uniref:hypothetical protein n=1 Tax=Leptospira santarosai TaxID=28183 RepID=UPI0002C00C4A|nr:hypothetical protein LEP1GSC175_3589 [Leptospira santarosai str. HAI821]